MSNLEVLSVFKIELYIFCWISSHTNIWGNDMADIAAKLALFLPITSMKILADEFIPGISKFCMNE